VCCQVEVSATGRSLVRRSRSECGATECELETSTKRRPRPEWDCCDKKNIEDEHKTIIIPQTYEIYEERLPAKGFDSRQGRDFFFFQIPRMALGPSKPSVEWVEATVFPGVEQRLKGTTHLHLVLKL
jgi:hypothetical protein